MGAKYARPFLPTPNKVKTQLRNPVWKVVILKPGLKTFCDGAAKTMNVNKLMVIVSKPLSCSIGLKPVAKFV